MSQEQIKKAAASYGRSLLAAVSALYMAGVTDPKDLWVAVVAAVAPVLLRAANPNDPAFGKLPDVKEFEEAAKAVKKPVKKKAVKKAAKKVAK
jgi:hypothetical protein